MARSTFEGPILSGDNRFGPQRNVGYTVLAQSAQLTLTNTSVNTANYGGASGQFVASNGIANSNGTVFTPGTNTAATITADSATALLRGVVFYVPTGSTIKNIFIDTLVVPTNAGGAITVTPYISNTFATSAGTIATAAALSAVGRTTATYTAAQAAVAYSTTNDVPGVNGNPALSQVVVTIAMTAASGLTTISAGQLIVSIEYTQADPNIGSTTAYPYGNFD
jgi:hypothetical protein